MARPSKGMDFQMVADSGVQPSKLPAERKPRRFDPRIQAYIDSFAAFKVGQSFFVEGVTRRDLEFVRRPFVAAGLGVMMREVEADEIYGSAGVRVWRQHGEYDERQSTEPSCTSEPEHVAQPAADPDYDPDLDGDPDDEL